MASQRTPQPLNISGRFIGGSLYKAKTHDDETKQRYTFKSGRQAGKNQDRFSVGVAVPKTQAHWGSEPGWGATIWAEGHAAWPQGQAQQPAFSWKIQDGDSTIPNQNQKRPCDQPGYAGHWILWFTAMFEENGKPQVATAVSGPPVWNGQPGLCEPGDYIEISGSVAGNESAKKPGVYLNLGAVCLRAYHPDGRIVSQRVDLSQFGAAPLPAGAVMQPAGNALGPAPAAPPVPPGAAAAPVATPSTPAAPMPPAAPAPAPSAPAPVVPNPAVLGAPPPVVVPPPPVAPAKTYAVTHGDPTYHAWVAQGWTDDTLRAAGHMAP